MVSDRLLVATKLGETLAVKTAVTEHLIAHPRPLEKQTYIYFIGNAHTAVHLHRFITHFLVAVDG